MQNCIHDNCAGDVLRTYNTVYTIAEQVMFYVINVMLRAILYT